MGTEFLPLLGSTTGTDFLKPRVGRSALIPEFQRHFGNEDPIAALKILGNKNKSQGGKIRLVRRMGNHTHVLVAKKGSHIKAQRTDAM
jgi:hypothetical protein